MTRLLFVPNPVTLLWLEESASPHELVDAILRGEWQPPSPYSNQAGRLNAYWQDGLVIVSTLTLNYSNKHGSNPRLSSRQRDVLKCLVKGLTTRQIARRLDISTRSVFYHIAELKRKFIAVTRSELIHKARTYIK